MPYVEAGVFTYYQSTIVISSTYGVLVDCQNVLVFN